MSNRVKGCTVLFEHDVTEEHAQEIKNAIAQLRGVIKVEAVPFDAIGDWFERTRIRHELRAKLFDALEK